MTNQPHICFICEEYPPAIHGGIGTMTRDLAEGLVRHGWRVTVVGVYSPRVMALGRVRDETVNGVRVVRLPGLNSRLPAKARILMDRLRLSRWLIRAQRLTPCDLIEVPDYNGWLAFGAPEGLPLICRLHGSSFYYEHELNRRQGSRLVFALEKWQLKRAAHRIAVSRYVGETTSRLMGQADQPFEVIYNAVDTAAFAPQAGVSVQPGWIVFTGSILPKKGVLELVRAFNMIGQRFTGAQLVLVGKNRFRLPDGTPYQDYLLEQLDPDLRTRLHFCGHVAREEVVNTLRQAQVCCYPSHSEAFAIAPLEAMAVGKPVVCANKHAAPEMIENGVSGLLCDPHSPREIAGCIAQVLEDGQFAAALGQAARARVERLFAARQWVDKNLEYYQQILLSKETINR
jgi:glycosyltransferase involved in cell wall biosynthesis